MTIEELLLTLGVSYLLEGHHHCRPGWAQLDCPVCSPGSGSYRLGIHLGSGAANCWSCGHLNTTHVLALVADQPHAQLREALRGVIRTRQEGLRPRGKLTLPDRLGPLRKPHLRYLERRGFDPDLLTRLWGLQGTDIHPRLPWRIFIPIHHEGRVVSWTTRGLTDREPRYINARPTEEALPAKSVLFGEDYCRHAVVITEGPFDAMRVGPGAVATLGLATTDAQVLRMCKYPRRIVCFDNSPQAQARATALCRSLQCFPGRTWNVVLDAKDPGEAPEREIRLLRESFLD